MNINLILPLSITMGIISYSFILNHFIISKLKQLKLNEVLAILIIPHAFRYIGMAFLIEGVTSQALDPRFAIPAAYGDLLAAFLALIAIKALISNWRYVTAAVWVFNVVGFLDLINAVTQGLRFTQDADLGATYFIPAVIVPLLLVTHVLIFKILLKKKL